MKTLAVLLMMATLQLQQPTRAATPVSWKISWQPAGKVRCNYPAPLVVQLKDEKNQPVSGAEVEIVLTMHEMPEHGEFKTPTRMTKPGIYEGTPTFLYGGDVESGHSRQKRRWEYGPDIHF